MTPDEIRAWWDDPVADAFKEKLNQYISDSIEIMRKSLAGNDVHNAMAWNARADVCEEMLDIKEQMIEELEGETE